MGEVMINDFKTIEVIKMILTNLGYESAIKYLREDNLDTFIVLIKKHAIKLNKLVEEINYYL